MATVIFGDFEWDDSKAASNLVDHGVSFEEAAEALATDTNSHDVADPIDPTRVLSTVLSPRARLLFVVSTEVTDRIRIISARMATKAEEREYADS